MDSNIWDKLTVICIEVGVIDPTLSKACQYYTISSIGSPHINYKLNKNEP